MKILAVIHNFLPNVIRGSEIYALNLAKELVARGHEICVFHRVRDYEQPEYEIRRQAIGPLQTITINNTQRDLISFSRAYENEMLAERFGETLDEVQPDVCHFHHLLDLSISMVEQAKVRSIPVVFTLHDFYLICQKGQLLTSGLELCEAGQTRRCLRCYVPYFYEVNTVARRVSQLHNVAKLYSFRFAPWIRTLRTAVASFAYLYCFVSRTATRQVEVRKRHVARLASLADCFIAPSRFLKRKFVQAGFPEDKIIYSDYGFDRSLFDGFERRPSDRVRFGFLGSFIPSKGVHILLEAFKKMGDRNAELNLFGDFSHGDRYLMEMKKAGEHPGVHFRGEFEYPDVARAFEQIDVLVVPSIWYENSPLVIHEAFLSHTPVLASDLGGMKELVQEGNGGLLFKTGDVADLTAKMVRIVREPDLLTRLGTQVPEVKSIAEDANEMEPLFERLVAGKGRT